MGTKYIRNQLIKGHNHASGRRGLVPEGKPLDLYNDGVRFLSDGIVHDGLKKFRCLASDEYDGDKSAHRIRKEAIDHLTDFARSRYTDDTDADEIKETIELLRDAINFIIKYRSAHY